MSCVCVCHVCACHVCLFVEPVTSSVVYSCCVILQLICSSLLPPSVATLTFYFLDSLRSFPHFPPTLIFKPIIFPKSSSQQLTLAVGASPPRPRLKSRLKQRRIQPVVAVGGNGGSPLPDTFACLHISPPPLFSPPLSPLVVVVVCSYRVEQPRARRTHQ